jgi:50S ribosome-binding GTPase
MPTFAWLTPPAPAAIALVVVPALPGLLDRVLPAVGASRFARLCLPDGTPVDELVADRLTAEHLLLMPHGGPGMRQAVTACLEAHGLVPGAAGVPFPDAARWQALAAAPSPAAVRWLLAHPDAIPPFNPALLRRPPLVLITGPVNAGKSTLLNAWCGRRRALVSDLPGTTRDLLAAETVIAGWRLTLLDSAGLRQTADPLERAGQELIAGARARADLVLSLRPPGADEPEVPGDLVVLGKADLRPPTTGPEVGPRWSDHDQAAGLTRLGVVVLARLGLPALPSG